MLTKLLFRTLPDHYPAGSAYAHFPFLEPEYMHSNVAKDPTLAAKYDWSRPRQPPTTVVVDTFEAAKQVLADPECILAYDKRVFKLITPGQGQVSSYINYKWPIIWPVYKSEKVFGHNLDAFISGRHEVEKALQSQDWENYFRTKISTLVAERSVKYPRRSSRCIDIVHDVINVLPIHWISEKIVRKEPPDFKTPFDMAKDWSSPENRD